ncbi:von Willebrand factor A domain-containing protein 7-like [Neosynchiropus ocellatus]
MLLLAALLSLAVLADGFLPMFTRTSVSHRDITERAVLRKTAEVCRDIAVAEGRFFSLDMDDVLTVDKVLMACSSSRKSVLSTIKFQTSLSTIVFSNGLVDVIHYFKARHHITDEQLEEGREVITRGSAAVKASVWRSSFYAGRQVLGSILHPLQDFYSHSNWVELGRTVPYRTLIQPDQPFVDLAGPGVPTCRSCKEKNCEDNLLPEILRKGLITTGYFTTFSFRKPRGKCSHGGTFDLSSYKDPKGGINKDSKSASHGSLHFKAAALAVDAAAELLEDIRMSVGNRNFLRLMGISQASVLCLVVDTTVSMGGDIAELRRVSFDLIDHRRGTELEPPAYILVPFNDPDFGPVQRTTDADVFKASIDRLTFGGGGDIPEMSLSGLQLALTAAPPYSEIFVFTDAPAKDVHLRGTIQALIESTKSTVTFMTTHSAGRWGRAVSGTQTYQLYSDLSAASGGLAIKVEKSELHDAMSVMMDSSQSAVVTVAEFESRPGRGTEAFLFLVDASLQNVVVYITGSPSLTFKFTDHSGESQTSSQSSGPLGTMTTTGNLRRVSLSNRTGLWELTVNSKDPYSVKITGQSSIDFIFNLVEAFEGAHGDFSLKEGRVMAGGNATLAITVAGGDTVKVTEVMLWEGWKQTRVNGALTSYGGGTYLVGFTGVPAGDYVVIMKGEDSNSSSIFQRQASTRLKTSSVSVTAEVNDTSIEPGSSVTVPFTVAIASDGLIDDHATGTFKVQANNDRDFPSSSPDSLVIGRRGGGRASGTVTLTAPASAASGSDVTLTIVAQNQATADVNYATLRFSIIAEVKDIYRPVCRTISTSKCASPSPCSSATWAFVTSITDAGGSGINTVEIHQGNGTLITSTVVGSDGENVTMVTYSASCCTEKVVLAAVDRAGNVGTCVGQAVTNSAGLGFAVEPSVISKYFLWSSLVVSLLCM